MKNFIYIIFLIASSSIYAQNTIESDALFLKYEQEYLKLGSSTSGPEYELANKNFYSKFTDNKVKNKFEKTKDKQRWLEKNYKKTEFGSIAEAVSSYNDMLSLQDSINKVSNDIQEIRNELLKKYDVNLIWETLQTRIKARR